MSFASMARRLAFALILMLTAFAAAPTPAQEIPDAIIQEAMIKEAMITFNDANLTGNYDVLLAKTAAPFRQKFTSADLTEMFKGFVEQKIDIATVAGMDPIDDVPPVVSGGVLSFKGHFATTPSPVNYALDFMVDNSAWRLVGFDITIPPAPQP